MGAYVMKFDEYSDIGTHWIALHTLNNREIRKFIGNKTIITNTFRTQALWFSNVWIFSIRFIDFMLANKNLTKFINLFYQMISKKMMI